jgi:isocitrate dehydrogenase
MPSRKAGEIDNRGSSFYLSLYWAQALAEQDKDADMKTRFAKMYKELKANEDKIANDMISVQGRPVNVGGYYLPDDNKAAEVMRPSSTLNKIIDQM